MIVGRNARARGAYEYAVRSRFMCVDEAYRIDSVRLRQICPIIPKEPRRGDGALLCDALIIGVVGHCDDRVRRIRWLVILRGLVFEIPCRRDTGTIRIPYDL